MNDFAKKIRYYIDTIECSREEFLDGLEDLEEVESEWGFDED